MIKKLNDICSFVSGNAWKSSEFADEGIPIIRINNLNTNDNDFKYWKGDYDKKYLIYEGDLLVSLSGTIKTFQWNGPEALLNQRIVKVTANPDTNQDWVYYQISHVIEQIANKGKHAVIKNVSINDLKNFEVDVPDFQTQNKIVAILDKASALVQKRQQTINLLDELLRAQFLEMFGDSYTNPKNWEQLPLENIVSTDCPLTYGIVQPGQELDEGTPIVRPVDLTQRVVGLSGLKKIDPNISEKFKRTILKGGEILMCVRGTTGVVSIASPELAGANVTRGITPIWFDDKLDPEFAYHLMISKGIQYKIQKKTYGIALQQINLRDLRSMEFIVPPKKLQAEFVTKSNMIFKVRDNLVRSLAEVNDLHNSIMQRAFSGKLSFEVTVELDALLEEVDLQKTENDLFSIITNEEYLLSLVNRLNNQEFENQDLYDKAKHVAFQLLKEEERLAQEYDEQSKSLKLVVK